MVNKLNSWLAENEKLTRQFCKDLLGRLKRTHLDPVLQQLKGNGAAKVSFDDIIGGYTRIKDDYDNSAKGAKDAIAAVFFEFHPVRIMYSLEIFHICLFSFKHFRFNKLLHQIYLFSGTEYICTLSKEAK